MASQDELRKVGAARGDATAFAAKHGIVDERRDALRSIVTELVTNAILHGGGLTEVSFRMDGDYAEITVRQRDVPSSNPGEDQSGFGLIMVRAFSDDLYFTATARFRAYPDPA